MSIVNITIKIKDKDIQLSLKEAEDLYYDLNKVFGVSKTIAPLDPYKYPYPDIKYKDQIAPFTVTCGGNANELF